MNIAYLDGGQHVWPLDPFERGSVVAVPKKPDNAYNGHFFVFVFVFYVSGG